MAPASTFEKVVVVQSGARDAYQVALALHQAGMLESLVTDLYWPADRPWARWLSARLPGPLHAALMQRNEAGLPSSEVRLCLAAGLTAFLLDKLPRIPFSWKRQAMRHADVALGSYAGGRARRLGAGLLSYSYYGYDAFSHYAGRSRTNRNEQGQNEQGQNEQGQDGQWQNEQGQDGQWQSGQGQSAQGRGMLFQLHPHPASMRRILQAELEDNPDCAESLRKEWELALPEEDFDHLVAEPRMAAHILAASSFTRQTLVENGISYERISVVPYGVDTTRFSPSPEPTRITGGPLRLLFVGRINQRKGIKYLLEALRLLKSTEVHLTVCGRVVDGLELFRPFGAQVEVRPSVSAGELLAAYRAADLFVFPSVAEGFGQVLLESLASGLPILSTSRTAAPDLIDEGVEGFVIDPRRPDLLAAKIDWAASHRAELVEMRQAARRKAEQFTWQRFRTGISGVVGDFLARNNSREADSRRAERARDWTAGYV